MRDLFGLLVVVAASELTAAVGSRTGAPWPFCPEWLLTARWAVGAEYGCVEFPGGLRVLYRAATLRCGPIVALYEAWNEGTGDEYIVLAANEVTGDEGAAMVARAHAEANAAPEPETSR